MERMNERTGSMLGKRREPRNPDRWIGRLRVVGWSIVGIVLLLPAIATQFDTAVDWSFGDFALAAVMLGGTGLLIEQVARRSIDNAFRAGAVLALLATLLLGWINAAVGFVGAGANTTNVLYVALVVFAFVLGGVVRFRAKGMVGVMVATALAHVAITVLAFVLGYVGKDERLAVVVINVFFITVWTTSALLFFKASKEHSM